MAQNPPETAPIQSRSSLQNKYRAVVAIPCCNEFETLPETLKSLEATGQVRDEVLVVVNVNQRASMDNRNNLATLNWLDEFETPLPLAWLDHVTDGITTSAANAYHLDTCCLRCVLIKFYHFRLLPALSLRPVY